MAPIRTGARVLMTLLLISMVAGTGHATQHEPESRPMTAAEFRELLDRLASAWNEGDAQKGASCFTEDAVYTEPPDKQEYRGRQQLFEFFGGAAGRRGQMRMAWHHIGFDEERQVGMGEFTFEYGGRVHGVTVVRVRDGLIANWREYYYSSPLTWDEFTRKNPF